MKKNLFGAVSAALALALAITSFGCESGNDNPIRAVTDADRAALDASVFKYVAKPSKYTAISSGVSTWYAEDTVQGTKGSYHWDSMANGKTVYNVEDAEHKLQGKEGDVELTETSTISLNAKDMTFTVDVVTTDSRKYAIRNYEYLSTGTSTYTYNSTKKVPFRLVTSATTGAATFGVTEGTASAASAVTDGEFVYTGSTTEAQARAACIAELKKAVDGQNKYIARLKDAPDASKSDLETANTLLATLTEYYDNACAQRDGATVVTVESKTTNGVTETTTKWLKKFDGDVVRSATSKSGSDNQVKGSYKLLSGGFQTGKILLTTIGKVTFPENADNTGTYTDAGDNNRVGNNAEDFPKATTTISGSNKQYDARVLTIDNGTITAPFVTTSAVSASGMSRNNVFSAKSYTTYKAAYDDAAETAAREYTDRNEVSYSWTK